MQVEWYGQSAFRLTDGDKTVFIDPFSDMSGLEARGLEFNYPAIDGVEAHLVLVTHEHGDHNGVDAIGGDPAVIRSTAGRKESPIGEVLAVASEHDAKAGTERGPNTIFFFSFGDLRIAHFGDFGQSELRPEQAEAIGPVDLLFIPVGAGPTIGPEQAHAIAQRLGARWVVPMHYRTERVNFLDPADAYLDLIGSVQRFEATSFDTAGLESHGSLALLPAVP
jgi:L-ascorbate metabolism protein UlaG (beta-lactamase superfamily)